MTWPTLLAALAAAFVITACDGGGASPAAPVGAGPVSVRP